MVTSTKRQLDRLIGFYLRRCHEKIDMAGLTLLIDTNTPEMIELVQVPRRAQFHQIREDLK